VACFDENKVTGLFFSKECAVIGDTFPAMMENVALCYVPKGTVFQLDDVPPHFSCHVCAFLDREFPVYWIGRGEPFPGPLVLHILLLRISSSRGL